MAIGKALCVALFTLYAYLAPPSADPRPTIAISPKTGIAPIQARITVTIPQNPHNREFCAAAFMGELRMAQSCRDLEGDKADVTYEFYWRLSESGAYNLVLGVQDDAGRITRASTEIELR
jgi:hypothetical protein